jgi:hypothetical protein
MKLDAGPFLWGARRDLWIFGASFALPLALVGLARLLGLPNRDLPEWGFLAFVVAVDVAHVYSTLFRTYFDRQELQRHPLRYWGLPLAAYLAAAVLWSVSPIALFRALAYLAVWHFVRQQAGWVALYRARAGDKSLRTRLIDSAAIYAATLFPLFYWHLAPESRRFAWFMSGDFLPLPVAQGLLPWARVAWATALAVFAIEQLGKAWRTRRLQVGKSLIVGGSALTWYVGIVATNGDFEFTVTNVLPHGVPYLALLYFYARERRREAPDLLGSRLLASGAFAFIAICLGLATLEELAWARWVFHDHPLVFGQGSELGRFAVGVLAPLLVVPQAVHYALDGLLWRRADSRARPAQRAALGLEPAAAAGESSLLPLARVVE